MPALIPLAAAAIPSVIGAFKKGPQAQQVDLKGASQAQADQSYGNTQQGLQQQQGFLNALQGQGGIQNQSDVYNQLALQAQGGGPNPAQMALNNATGQNVANQAALMAGQRGAGANAGMIARQAGMQGGALQQQAAGQGALMQAQQQQAAISGMGNIAGQQVSNLGNAGNAYANTALGQQGNVLNSLSNQNSAAAGLAAQGNQVNMANAQQQDKMMGSLANAGGAAATKLYESFQTPAAPNPYAGNTGGAGGGMGRAIGGLAQGGEVSEKGPKSALGRSMKGGGQVPGNAKVAGDSLKNDTVSALLSPGEIVIPRTIAQGKNAPAEAAKFVAACLAKSKRKK